MEPPRVSVIMTVYNGEKYIGEAIKSLLCQTMANFELIVIDDGSIDNTVKIVKEFNDKRIKLLQNETNKGSIYSRNRGVLESIAEYLAILDSDDTAMPKRLEMESDFLDSHLDFGVVGTAVELIDENSKPTGVLWKNKLPPEMIPGILLFQSYFANSSTMFRKIALPSMPPYRDMNPADDVDLWLRIDKKWKMQNLSQILTQYRVHGNNMSILDSARGKVVMRKMITEAMQDRFNIIPTDEEFEIHRYNYKYDGKEPVAFFKKREDWLLKLQKKNQEIKYYDQKTFSKILADRWLTTCSSNTRFGMSMWKKFWQSKLSDGVDLQIHLVVLIKFFIKSLLKKDYLSLRTLFN